VRIYPAAFDKYSDTLETEGYFQQEFEE
jgi:hypothetical protein